MAVIGALIWKLQADIADLVKNTDQIGATMQRVSDQADRASQAFQRFGGALGLSLSGAGLVQAARGAMAYADSLGELSLGAGVSAEAMQELSYVAKLNGADMQTMSATLLNLAERVGSADEKTRRAVEDLGISWQRLRLMSPDEMLMEVSRALREVEDPARRNADAMDALGKSWKAIMPTMLSDMEAIRAAAPKMSDAMVKSLGDANDRLDDLATRSKVATGWILDKLIPAIEGLGARVGKFTWGAEQGAGGGANFWTSILRLGGTSGDVLAESLGAQSFEQNPLAREPKSYSGARGNFRIGGIDLEAAENAMKRSEDEAKRLARTATETANEWNRAFEAMERKTEQSAERIVAALMKQKDVLNNLTQGVLKQWMDMNERQGLDPTGQRRVPQGTGYDAELYAAQQQRDEEIRGYQRELDQLGPNASGPMQKMIEALIEDAEKRFQEKAYELWEKFLAGGQAAESFSQSTQRAAGAADRFASALAPPAGNGRSGMVTPGVTAGLSAADMAMYRASLDTIHMGNGPLRDSLIATKLAGMDMSGLGRSGAVTIAPNVNLTNARFNSPQDADALAREVARAIQQMMSGQGRIW